MEEVLELLGDDWKRCEIKDKGKTPLGGSPTRYEKRVSQHARLVLIIGPDYTGRRRWRRNKWTGVKSDYDHWKASITLEKLGDRNSIDYRRTVNNRTRFFEKSFTYKTDALDFIENWLDEHELDRQPTKETTA